MPPPVGLSLDGLAAVGADESVAAGAVDGVVNVPPVADVSVVVASSVDVGVGVEDAG
ncbi:hypothetical protein [Mycolicibacterium helvum]|uniref:hypothetical protein n=1 Tax=Mycolicibacterium helvum TaxID=1534349 RepID=UPI0013D414C1|nr:hypothetical protein [Mycolicibacterium helvum]